MKLNKRTKYKKKRKKTMKKNEERRYQAFNFNMNRDIRQKNIISLFCWKRETEHSKVK